MKPEGKTQPTLPQTNTGRSRRLLTQCVVQENRGGTVEAVDVEEAQLGRDAQQRRSVALAEGAGAADGAVAAVARDAGVGVGAAAGSTGAVTLTLGGAAGGRRRHRRRTQRQPSRQNQLQRSRKESNQSNIFTTRVKKGRNDIENGPHEASVYLGIKTIPISRP